MKATPEVCLVPLEVDHLPHIMTWVNDQDVTGYFANRQKQISAEEEVQYIKTIRASSTDFVWSVFTPEGDYVGQCSINQVYWPARNGRIFIVVTKTRQGKGYATAILLGLQKMAQTLGLHKLWLIVREDNTKAQALWLKGGFKFEGLLKDHYWVRGKYHNMVHMGWINPGHS
jgi:diamine N-acetyltransferase